MQNKTSFTKHDKLIKTRDSKRQIDINQIMEYLIRFDIINFVANT